MGRFAGFKQTGEEMSVFRRIVETLLTFHIVCFGWILFRADSMQTVHKILTQIFNNFHPKIFTQFITGYPIVFSLMITGYLFHFMPKKADLYVQNIVTRAPLLIQAILLIVTIFVVIQFKNAGVQPFIYFQF
jgi:hypothetical protein